MCELICYSCNFCLLVFVYLNVFMCLFISRVRVSAAVDLVRDGVKKSKWKFKMAFAMKGGGLEGVSSATYLF